MSSHFAGVTISPTTYATWQAVLVVLSIVSASLNIWKMTRGAKQNDATTMAMRDELKADIKSLKDEVKSDIKATRQELRAVREDVENTTQRLEAHIDRASGK
jgi:uncharacterized protein HemX